MAAINFPDAPTNGQIFESGGMSWTYVAGIGWTLNSAIVEAGSGFTFIADTMPLPVNVGDTWFDSSTGASGGNSYVAVEEGPAGASEKVWVQFAPGQQAIPPNLPVPTYFSHAFAWGHTANASITRVQLSNQPRNFFVPVADWTADYTNHLVRCNRPGMYQVGFQHSWAADQSRPGQSVQAFLTIGAPTGVVVAEYFGALDARWAGGGATVIKRLAQGDYIYLDHYASINGVVQTRDYGNLWATRLGD